MTETSLADLIIIIWLGVIYLLFFFLLKKMSKTLGFASNDHFYKFVNLCYFNHSVFLLKKNCGLIREKIAFFLIECLVQGIEDDNKKSASFSVVVSIRAY